MITVDYSGEGLVGIRPEEVDLGWYVRPDRWGAGIAPEAAAAAIAWCAEQGIAPLVVRLRPGNAASRRVAEKLDFRLDGEGRAKNGDAVEIYRQLP